MDDEKTELIGEKNSLVSAYRLYERFNKKKLWK